MEELSLGQIKNEMLRAYIAFFSGTESPPLFDAWAAVSAASACLGRRCWFQLGAIRIPPNQYVMLVGAPGVRKSTCISMAKKLLPEGKGPIRYAPNNTAGRPQGLISAIMGEEKKRKEMNEVDEAIMEIAASFDMEDLIDEEETNAVDKHAIYVAEGELAGFLGVKSTEFITFLTDMWDKAGEDKYEYSLKGARTVLSLPCLNIIGAITPQHITSYLPPEAIGQGFMSRLIIVYAEAEEEVPWPEPLDEKLMLAFKAAFERIATQMQGEFEYEPEVKQAIIRKEFRAEAIEDARFLHYRHRRHVHLLKTAMALAALDGRLKILHQDLADAHIMLSLAEERMAESLGEYGLSPIALARARVIELLKAADEPMTGVRLGMAIGGDVKQADMQRAIMELTQSGQVIDVAVRDATGAERSAYIVPRPLFLKAHREGKAVDVKYLVDQNTSRRPRTAPSRNDLAALASPQQQDELRAQAEAHARAEQKSRPATAGLVTPKGEPQGSLADIFTAAGAAQKAKGI